MRNRKEKKKKKQQPNENAIIRRANNSERNEMISNELFRVAWKMQPSLQLASNYFGQAFTQIQIDSKIIVEHFYGTTDILP